MDTTYKEQLPDWDLTDLYSSPDSPEFQRDLATLTQQITNFTNSYQSKVQELTAEALAVAIQTYEAIAELLTKLAEYAFLSYVTQTQKEEITTFFQNTTETVSQLQGKLIFFDLELCQLEETQLQSMYQASTSLTHYQPFIRHVRLFREHNLSEETERVFSDTSITSNDAWIRLYDETMASLQFKFRGETLNEPEITSKLLDDDEAVRREAGKISAEVFAQHSKIFTYIMNVLAKDKSIADQWHHYPQPVSARNIGNMLSDTTVNCLVETVKRSYQPICQRYYRLKAKIMGKPRLHYTDRNAPLNLGQPRKFSWTETKQLVHDAYQRFSPTMAEIGDHFFTHNWIDVPPKTGKQGGAFATSCVPSVHPYLLLNFQHRLDDVFTLAHELGHGINQYLAAQQGILMNDNTLPFAETASIFGEQLLFAKLFAEETDPKRKIDLAAHKIEEMIATIIRQISYHSFETKVHQARQSGELNILRISQFWMEEQYASFGDTLEFEDNYQYTWARVSHFFHYPFYVYAYAFAGCLVHSLYQAYSQQQVPEFEPKFVQLLASGGTLTPEAAVEPFGFDINDSNFWQQGLDLISELIDTLEQLSIEQQLLQS